MSLREALMAASGFAFVDQDHFGHLFDVAEAADKGDDGRHLAALRQHLSDPKLYGELGSTKGYEVRGGGAYIDVSGFLMHKPGVLERFFFGAGDYLAIAEAVQKASADPAVRTIVLDINTPGGSAIGVAECAAAIKAATKPTIAFARMALSAGYRLAAACDRIVVSPTGSLGSVGAIVSMYRPPDRPGVYQFVSALSPNKVADPSTEAGAQAWQQMVDDLGLDFGAEVARNRGLSGGADEVQQKYGAGGMFVGARALEMGLADAVGTTPIPAEESPMKINPATMAVLATVLAADQLARLEGDVAEDTLNDVLAGLKPQATQVAAPQPAASQSPAPALAVIPTEGASATATLDSAALAKQIAEHLAPANASAQQAAQLTPETLQSAVEAALKPMVEQRTRENQVEAEWKQASTGQNAIPPHQERAYKTLRTQALMGHEPSAQVFEQLFGGDRGDRIDLTERAAAAEVIDRPPAAAAMVDPLLAATLVELGLNK